MRAVRCAIVGCGMVAEEYAATLAAAGRPQLVACADLDARRAEAFAVRHRLTYRPSLEALLGAGDIELLMVLTPPATHMKLAHQAIKAGVSVYVEKPLCLNRGEATGVLVEAERHGVRVGAAPDTFLGPAVQTASQAIKACAIGEPLSADAALLSCGPENWHPAPEPFYAAELGPLLDMGPYYLSVLTYLLGPVTHVVGAMTSTRSRRTIRTGPRAGEHFAAGAPTRVDALFRTSTGLPVTFAASFDTVATVRPHLEIYGTEGTLQLPDPNFHDGEVRLRRRGQDTWSVLPTGLGGVSGRGMGVVDLADAIAEQRPHRAVGERARHVLAVAEAIHEASLAGCQVAVRGF